MLLMTANPLRLGKGAWLLLVACWCALAGPASGSLLGRSLPFDQGEKVTFTGVVHDREGRPVAGVQVVLAAWREALSLRQRGRVRENLTRRATTSNERGEFAFEWVWDDYYDRFEIQATLPIRKGSGERLEVLSRADLTSRLRLGSPVVASLTIEDTAFLEAYRSFVASVQAPEQQQVFEQMGKPDLIEEFRYPDDLEISWWYFESGRVYRFRAGALAEVAHFEPVRPF